MAKATKRPPAAAKAPKSGAKATGEAAPSATITPEQFAAAAKVGKGKPKPEIPEELKLKCCKDCDSALACVTLGRCRIALLKGKPDIEGRKRRPSKFSDDIANTILTRLAEGEGLNDICKDEGMPAESTVRDWVKDDHEGFGAKYARARDLGVDCRADNLRNLANMALGLPNEGVAAVRLMVDTEKWYLSKIAPKRYGDKLDVTIDDKRPETPEARKARIAELIAAGIGDDPEGV